jgi:hypothetical protein
LYDDGGVVVCDVTSKPSGTIAWSTTSPCTD